jgi:hypothetical protein
VLEDQKEFAEAEALFREALALQRKFLGDQHPTIGGTLSDVARMLEAQAKYSEAEPLRRRPWTLSGNHSARPTRWTCSQPEPVSPLA